MRPVILVPRRYHAPSSPRAPPRGSAPRHAPASAPRGRIAGVGMGAILLVAIKNHASHTLVPPRPRPHGSSRRSNRLCRSTATRWRLSRDRQIQPARAMLKQARAQVGRMRKEEIVMRAGQQGWPLNKRNLRVQNPASPRPKYTAPRHSRARSDHRKSACAPLGQMRQPPMLHIAFRKLPPRRAKDDRASSAGAAR